MLVTCREMKEIEERAFAAGISAETLMEEAGALMAAQVKSFFPSAGICHIFFGKGHNGGDALVTARHLAQAGWQIESHPVFPRETLAPLTQKKLVEAEAAIITTRRATAPQIVLDGMLGIGAKRGLTEPIRSAAGAIQRLRRENGATVFAMDIPTGLDGDTGEADPEAVVADFTLCVGFAKRGLVADAALDFVGRLAVLPLAGLIAPDEARSLESIATPHTLAGLLPPRRYSTYKGDCGRVGIVAGSRGFTGAAVMAAQAAVRAGAGLVSLFVTPDIYPIVASAAMPEVMVTPVDCYLAALDFPLDALAIGPGVGLDEAPDVLAVIEYFAGPMVVDADALNALSKSPEALRRAAGPRLLTPHPGEMRRLFPASGELSRKETAERYLQSVAQSQSPVTLLLKGSRTLVAESITEGLRVSYNSTGNPGMASGGMGDILSGVCAALAGQGLSLFDTARLGAWVCGRAAERAVTDGQSQESLAATDLLAQFGRAFNEIRQSVL
jgi:NAD(P)H-hydrate epimerase